MVIDTKVPVERLLTHSGRALSKKRTLLRRFESENPFWQYDEVSDSNIDRVFFAEREYQFAAHITGAEQAEVAALFRELHVGVLQAGVLLSGERVQGYCISRIAGEVCTVLLLRVISGGSGILPMLYREHTRLMLCYDSGLKFLDLGTGALCMDTDERRAYLSK